MSSSGLPPIGSLKPLAAHFFRTEKHQSAPLFNLPTEILIEIFSHTDLKDSISLGITCKHLLNTLTYTAFHKCFLAKKFPNPAPIKLILFLLRLLWPRHLNGVPKKDLRFCIACLHISPVKKKYWEDKLPVRISRELWNSFMSQWEMYMECPLCLWNQNHGYKVLCECFYAFISQWEQMRVEHTTRFGK